MLDAVPLFLLLTALAWVALGAVTLKRVKQAREPEQPSAEAAHPYAAAVLGNMGIPAKFINRRSLYDRWRETWIGPEKSSVRVMAEPIDLGERLIDDDAPKKGGNDGQPWKVYRTRHRLPWDAIDATMNQLGSNPPRHPDDPSLISDRWEATGIGFDPKSKGFDSGLLTIWYRPVTPKDTERPRDGRFRR
jgi:hypothetical protein